MKAYLRRHSDQSDLAPWLRPSYSQHLRCKEQFLCPGASLAAYDQRNIVRCRRLAHQAIIFSVITCYRLTPFQNSCYHLHRWLSHLIFTNPWGPLPSRLPNFPIAQLTSAPMSTRGKATRWVYTCSTSKPLQNRERSSFQGCCRLHTVPSQLLQISKTRDEFILCVRFASFTQYPDDRSSSWKIPRHRSRFQVALFWLYF